MDRGSYWQRAWIFVGLERWADAIAALKVAAEKDPANAPRADIIPTLKELAATPEVQRWTTECTARLTRYLETAGAGGPLAALTGKLRLGAVSRHKLVEDRVAQWLGKSPVGRVSTFGAGLIGVSLEGLNLDTVAPLTGC